MNTKHLEAAMKAVFDRITTRAAGNVAEDKGEILRRISVVASNRSTDAMKALTAELDAAGVGYGPVHEVVAMTAAATAITSALGSYEIAAGRESPMTADEMRTVVTRVCFDVKDFMDAVIPSMVVAAAEVRAGRGRASEGDQVVAALERLMRGGRLDG